MQVMKALQQQQMLQAAGGIEGLVALLQTSPGDASTQQTTTLIVYCQTYHTGHMFRRGLQSCAHCQTKLLLCTQGMI